MSSVWDIMSKSKKSGPLKALSSVFTSEEKNSDGGKLGDYHPHLAAGTATSTAPSSSSSTLAGKKKNSPIHASKDDLSMTRKKDKNKVKANPYATIKMWRPITMTSSVSHDEDVYRTFTNFDVLVDEAKLPATGDLRNDDFHTGIHADSTALSTSYASSPGNGFLSGSSFNDKSPLGRSLSSNTAGGGSLYSNSDHNGHHQPDDLSRSSPSPTTDMNGDADIPADYPQHSSPSLNSLRARSVSADSRDRADSNERRGRTVTESSYMVVSPDVASSVKGVLIKTYGPEGFDAAAQDVEGMLGQLKLTMETLKTAQARVSSSGSQFQTVKQELQLQTKQFVQDAKCMVTAATGSREAIAKHLHAAMHTLAKVLLHSQATMVRMRSVHQAQHLGFEIIKVSASFKSTVAAANAAIGKPTTEPHMKYLMRQATNLAGLLSTLLKTLKNLDQN
nr:hypothetical protein BaRGS_000787 [Batillaria attramentaria]